MLQRFKERFSQFVAFLAKRPATSFFGLIAVLFGIIALGHFLRTPEQVSEDRTPEPKTSLVFDTSDDRAMVTLPAKVKKESVVHIVALAPGMVTNILTTPGRRVISGQTLMTLTGDYQSGSTDIAKRLAAEQARLTEELAGIDKDITALEEKRIRHDSSMTDSEQDVALEQLKKERATRHSTLEQNALSLQISNLSDAVLKPKTFASGTVQSISVKRGDLVSAGQVLATIYAPAGATTLEAFLDPETARLFDPTTEAKLTIGDTTLSLLPTYFAQSENENGLFSVLFTLSPDMTSKITNGEFLRMSLPLKKGMPNFTLVPLDAVFQDEQEAWVLVEHDGKAEARKVTIGNLYGSFASVLSGLEEHDRILLNRSIIAGDQVSLAQ